MTSFELYHVRILDLIPEDQRDVFRALFIERMEAIMLDLQRKTLDAAADVVRSAGRDDLAVVIERMVDDELTCYPDDEEADGDG